MFKKSDTPVDKNSKPETKADEPKAAAATQPAPAVEKTDAASTEAKKA
jgi:hypothetical protein